MYPKRKILVDCDAGNDDAEAILMALSDPKVDIVAITTVCGNTGTVQVARNVLRLLKVADRLDIPVHIGCKVPLLGDVKQRHEYHGNDGLGDVPDANVPDDSHVQSEHGVDTILRLTKQFPGEITLVCLGPLTNLATAIRLDADIGQRLKQCLVMGGNYLGKGNITPAAEFNFYWDPEAAYVVLNQLKCHVTLLPWETCLEHSLDWEFYNQLRSVGTPKSELLKRIYAHSIRVLKKYDIQKMAPADQLCMAVLLRSDVIKSCVDVYATVEVNGKYTTGQMVVDWQNLYGKEPNVTIVTAVHDQIFRSLLYQGSDSNVSE